MLPSTVLPLATIKNSSSMHLQIPSAIPREIKDAIIDALIMRYGHSPAYQWTHLRYITRFHQQQLEKHFYRHWLRRLIITIYETRDHWVDYRVRSGVEKQNDVIVRFKAQKQWAHLRPESKERWGRWIWNEEKRIVLRLSDIGTGPGETSMNEGYMGGAIISDAYVPELTTDETGKNIWFDWKKLFSTMFEEEMLMRKVDTIMVSFGVFMVCIAIRSSITNHLP